MRRLRCLGLMLALSLLLSCCAPKEYSAQTFAMDTVMSFTSYGREGERAVSAAAAEAGRLEGLLSVTRPESDIYAVNHAAGAWTQVSQETFDLIGRCLELCRACGGALDITAYPAVRAWGFTTGEYRVPGAEERVDLAARIDYTAVELDREQCRVRLPEGMELDLGAVAKGYAGDVLAGLTVRSGAESAMLYLGGNVHTVGRKPDGSLWRVGVQDPQGEGYLAVVEVENQAAVTSGGYQRFFEAEGETYWHILDPASAAPARSGVLSATVVGDCGLVCDGLSTALFVLGAEEAARLWRTLGEFEYILILEDGSVQITQGREGRFSLAGSGEGREVQVIRP